MRYVLLTVALGAFLLFFGVRLISSTASFVANLVGHNTSSSSDSNGPPPTPPRINTPPRYTNQASEKIEGSARPGSDVVIFFNSHRQEVVANAEGQFTGAFTLSEGDNTVYAVTIDSSGRQSSSSSVYTITLDKEPPSLEILSPENEQRFSGSRNQNVRISGKTDLEARVSINDRVAVVRGDGTFEMSLNLAEGENAFLVKSVDRAGNQSEQQLVLFYSP